VSAVAPARAAGEIRKGPYLLQLSSSSVDLRVELASAARVSVDVVLDPRPDARAGTTVVSPSATFHSIHVAGLSPATRYAYSVHAGTGSVARGSFVTAPADSSREPFTFLIYGDNRTDGPSHERLVAAMVRERFDFLVHTGDFVEAGDDEGGWQSFFDIERPLLSDHALFACVGNHELANDRSAAHFERYFGPAERMDASAPAPALYGSFRWGRTRFFLLNAFTDWASGPERAWLDDALARAEREADVDVRIAVIHQGPFSAGPHGGSRALLAAHVDRLLVAHHVDLVLSGHDHIYERGDSNGLKYIVTGGGGAPLYREISRLASTRKVEATYNYVLATVTGDLVAITAKRADGSIVDQCSFAHGGGWRCDAAKSAPTAAAPTPTPPEHVGCTLAVRTQDGRGPGAVLSLLVALAAAVLRRVAGAGTTSGFRGRGRVDDEDGAYGGADEPLGRAPEQRAS